MVTLLAPAAVAVACLTGGARLDVEIGRRATPWLPPDLARQVGKHEREFAAGAAAAARLPAASHQIHPVGMGDRVCVDTCSLLSDGEGMLMGNTSSAMLLVHAETLENPYVAPRPFRVNAGAVHAYILMPDGKTAYLSDLAIGGLVLVSDAKGTAHTAIIGRTKIERRPLLLVEAEAGTAKVSLILQNAETIRLVR